MARFLALGLAAVSLTVSAETQSLTTANFDAETKNGDLWMVKFFAPWCGHCKKLAPTWDALAEETLVTNSGKKIHFANVDCTAPDASDLCTTQGVKGYPTLLSFSGDSGEATKYQGGREADALRAYAIAQ